MYRDKPRRWKSEPVFTDAMRNLFLRKEADRLSSMHVDYPPRVSSSTSSCLFNPPCLYSFQFIFLPFPFRPSCAWILVFRSIRIGKS